MYAIAPKHARAFMIAAPSRRRAATLAVRRRETGARSWTS
jgi:hypothetical protein